MHVTLNTLMKKVLSAIIKVYVLELQALQEGMIDSYHHIIINNMVCIFKWVIFQHSRKKIIINIFTVLLPCILRQFYLLNKILIRIMAYIDSVNITSFTFDVKLKSESAASVKIPYTCWNQDKLDIALLPIIVLYIIFPLVKKVINLSILLNALRNNKCINYLRVVLLQKTLVWSLF